MSDAYQVIVAGEPLDATAARRMFGRMPWWIGALMRNRLVAPLGLKTGRDEATSTSRRIGFFPLIAEAPQRVLLGLDDKHLDFRVTVDVAPTTLVRTHNTVGRIYLAMVLPFHRLIVPAMLRQVEKP